jgi:hypothetical protein
LHSRIAAARTPYLHWITTPRLRLATLAMVHNPAGASW